MRGKKKKSIADPLEMIVDPRLMAYLKNNAIWELYRFNVLRVHSDLSNLDILSNFIHSFGWGNSIEGFSYWHDHSMRYENET